MKETFGEFIRRLRNQKGLTLTQLAAKLELDSANLSKIENGKREFDEKKIDLLCASFELNRKDVEKELLSEKVAKKLYSYPSCNEILTLAEEKIKYYRSKNTEQGNLKFKS
ncbi:MAG: helix-turn-helix domain-containing protein [Cytophagales bacterium]|nr:helix-turn-helix domain-containing protein [Cytophagales bacterium]